MVFLEEGKIRRVYLLSYDVGIVTGLNFEGAVVRPEVNGIGNARNAAFVDLLFISFVAMGAQYRRTISAASVPAIENSRSAYFFQ